MTLHPDLFEPAVEPAKERAHFDVFRAAAIEKLHAPPEWEWYALEALRPTSDTLVTGGIPNRGAPSRKWRGVRGQKIVVTDADIEAAQATFERETGRCARCAGNGDVVASISVAGNTYRTCDRCRGDGKAGTP